MCVALSAVMVTVPAVGAMMFMTDDGARTVTAGDRGAMMVRVDPIGPSVARKHSVGEM